MARDESNHATALSINVYTLTIQLNPVVLLRVVHAPRRCPIHIKEDVRNEINQMEELGVIKKVEEPTDWVPASYSAEN